METTTDNNGIKEWAVEDRPREKLIRLGARDMSNAELLAIVLRSGSQQENAMELSQRILRHYDNDIQAISCLSVEELCLFNGVGPAKAVAVKSAFQLGKRAAFSDSQELFQIQSSRDIYNTMRPLIAELYHEEFWVILLNRSNRVISKFQLSVGGVSATVVDAKIVFKKALNMLASSIILVHNHPSGNVQPSRQDRALTKKLQEGASLIDIRVLDHVIVTKSDYYSFMDEGDM